MVSGLERKYVGLLRTEKQILNDSKCCSISTNGILVPILGSTLGSILNSTLQLLSHKYTE